MKDQSTDIVFYEKNKLFARTIPIGLKSVISELSKDCQFDGDPDEIEQKLKTLLELESNQVIVKNILTRFHAEFMRTLNFYRSQQGGSPISSVLVGGHQAEILNLKSFISLKMGDIVLDMDTKKFFLYEDDQELPDDLAVVAGVAVRENKKVDARYKMTIVPRSVFARRAKIVRALVSSFIGIGLSTFIGLLVFYIAVNGWFKLPSAPVMTASVKHIEAPAQVVVELIDSKNEVSSLIRKISEGLNNPVISFDKNSSGELERITFSGKVSDTSEVLEFVKKVPDYWSGCKTQVKLQPKLGGYDYEVTFSK